MLPPDAAGFEMSLPAVISDEIRRREWSRGRRA